MRVVVVGGGFAGLAAAIALQEHRHEVTLLERRGVLGGRATSYPDRVTGEDVDNGTHLMIAGYDATLSGRRAAAVASSLIQRGVASARLSAGGSNEGSSVDGDCDAQELHRNRQVIVIIENVLRTAGQP